MSNFSILEDVRIGVRLKVSALWIAMLFLFAYGDIFGFFAPGRIEEVMGGEVSIDVARNDPNRANGELDDRLRAVNARAIDLTEALLLLSRADQRSFTREDVDLSLLAEEATETLLPLAEKRGLTIETSGDTTPTIGSHPLLLQLTTNLVHNAIVHNLPEQGTV